MRRLSSSSLKTYRRCPQQWKLKYVDRLPEEDKPFFNLGRAVHAALEAFYRGRVAGPPPLEEVVAAFEDEFDPEAYPTEEETDRRRADGLAMVEAYYRKHADGFQPALAVEKRLAFEVEGVPFTGYVDRIDKTGRSRIGIVDYKTGGSFDLERVRTEPQLTLYQLGTEAMLGLEVERLALYHVPSQTPFQVERHGPEQVERVRGMVREAARGIEAGDFEPSPGHHCTWCDFQPFCPAFADEYPENWLQEPPPPAPTHAEAAALADRYGALRQRKKELGEELDEVRARLEAFFEATGERAVAGAETRVKGSRKDEWRIEDDGALREVLEPAGLWEKVLKTGVDWRAKAALPEDEALPEAVRQAVRRLAERRVSWRLTAGEVEGEGDDA
ncbi:MAG TPA: PD-(D/E)XK nuclease family protein [Gemmatimonadota bacterium]|nr:PD-(D/E)XK nuclease family protein [Gemmatimonadota bacterium]